MQFIPPLTRTMMSPVHPFPKPCCDSLNSSPKHWYELFGSSPKPWCNLHNSSPDPDAFHLTPPQNPNVIHLAPPPNPDVYIWSSAKQWCDPWLSLTLRQARTVFLPGELFQLVVRTVRIMRQVCNWLWCQDSSSLWPMASQLPQWPDWMDKPDMPNRPTTLDPRSLSSMLSCFCQLSHKHCRITELLIWSADELFVSIVYLFVVFISAFSSMTLIVLGAINIMNLRKTQNW